MLVSGRPVCVGIVVRDDAEALADTLDALGPGHAALVLLAHDPDRATAAALRRYAAAVSVTGWQRGTADCWARLAALTDADVLVLLRAGARPAPGSLGRLVATVRRERDVAFAGPSTNAGTGVQCFLPGGAGDPAGLAASARELDRRFGDEIRTVHPPPALDHACLVARRDLVTPLVRTELAASGRTGATGDTGDWMAPWVDRAAARGLRSVWACGAYVWQPSSRAAPAQARSADAPPAVTLARSRIAEPLVSCVMPTRGRPEFAVHAVELFMRQTYGAKELIVVDDGDDDLETRLPDDPRVRYLRAPRGESIGAKRNRACAVAAGRFVAQWDDDDWYGPDRLSAQLAPLLEGRADITALRLPVFFELDAWRFWLVTPELHRQLFCGDVHGGTLAFTREVWQRRARYPDASLAEDAAFLERACRHGARLTALDSHGLYVYVRHGSNAWSFACGRFPTGDGWHQVAGPAFPAADRRFYAQRSRARAAPTPLVSCIMPTRNRRRWAGQAIAYYARQDYPHRELIVVDDGEDPIEDVVPERPDIRYVRLSHRHTVGAKRNLAVELASGELIAHWDDDDWQATGRVREQVAALEAHGAALCGPSELLFFDPRAGRAWRYVYPRHERPWVAGGALCYRRERWERGRFEPIDAGEDNAFVWNSREPPLVLDAWRGFAAVVHAGNTSPKRPAEPYWHPEPIDAVHALVGADWTFYAGLA